MFRGLSRIISFYGVYFDDNTTAFDRVSTFVPREDVNQYIALHTPYVYYRYPDGFKKLYGSALTGYNLKYVSADTNMDLFFHTNVEKTIDQADHPLNFTTYERSYGTLHGSILLDGKRYNVTHAEGYLDHMITIGICQRIMDFRGWSWFELTTRNYQAVAYAIRGMDDGYDARGFNPITAAVGLVDFMAFQPDGAVIQYNGNIEEGSAFYEYFPSGWVHYAFVKMLRCFLQEII